MTKMPVSIPHASVSANAVVLERELNWASAAIEVSIKLYFGQECEYADIRALHAPDITDIDAPYADVLREHAMTFEARMVLILALAPHLRPQLLDPFLMKNNNYDRNFTEFGGVFNNAQGGFMPTVETAAFVLCGVDLGRRLELVNLFGAEQYLRRERLLELDTATGIHGLFSTPLVINKEQLSHLTTGVQYRPECSNSFPAKRLNTPLEWEDLVLNETTMEEVEEIKAWIMHRDTLMQDWQLARHVKPGFRSLFYGPPGTGKTLTASLLGKNCGLDVYRIDLSLVVSKYIGETEKNLANVFDQAERRNWILFFDEADSLFGKRVQTNSSNDRYANQEVGYLLQRVEDFSGVVILATNLKSNIDDAFARRFQSMIYFPIPDVDERTALWQKAFSHQDRLDADVDLAQIAHEFELSGGAVSNVVRYASLMALRRGAQSVRLDDVRTGIRRELRKEGKMM
jgi:hypothetical protein